MYERIQYSTEEIREVIQTLRRIYDNAEKNLKEWTQIKALLQECSFSKENKEILQRVEKQCNIIKTEMEALIYKLYRVNAVYEKVEQKNKKLIQKIQNNQTGKLLGQYKKLCSEQHDNILLMNKVSLMSSENIHINSFMFEPIIDMSIKSLVDLFGRVSLLVD